jgi:hypothetical protein
VADSDPRPSFLDLPAELRNMIYRLLLRSEDTLKKHTIMRTAIYQSKWKSHHCSAVNSSRSCRQIYHEALLILYGENTWQLVISNIPGYLPVFYPLLDWQPLHKRPSNGHTLQLLRRFDITIIFNLHITSFYR